MNVKIKGLHNKQLEIAHLILGSDSKYHTINASRQSGKSYLLTKLMLTFALKNREDILLVSPTYDQSKKIFDNLISINNIFILISNIKNSKPYEIEFINGSKITFKSAERSDNIRGGTYSRVFVDEMAFIKTDVFNTVIRPTTAAKKNSKIICVSTPKGSENEFYELAQFGQDEKISNYQYYYMHYSDNPHYDLEEVEDAKIRLPKDIFRQEYDAEFVEDGGEVFSDLDIVMNIEKFAPYNNNERYFAGIDFGRADDKTVLTILNLKREVVFMKDWNKMSWEIIINELALNLNIFKPICYAESNGVGDALIAQLRKKYRNVQEFLTTNKSKNEIVEKLRMFIFKDEISLPTKELYPLLSSELNSYTFTMNKTGTISYHHKPNHHDDTVDSLMIANYCYENHNKGIGNLIYKKKTIY